MLRSVLVRTKFIDMTVGMAVALIGVAILAYRGRTLGDRQRTGTSFWETFLRDSWHQRTIGEYTNLTGSRLAFMAMLVLVLGIVVAFSLAPEVIPSRRRLGRVLAWLGSVGSAGLVAAPVVPNDIQPMLHSAAVVLGVLPTILAFAILVGALLLEPTATRPLRFISLLLLILVVVALTLYAWATFLAGPSLRLLAAVECVATLLLLVWLVWIARFVRIRLVAAYIAAAQRAKLDR